MEKFAIMSIEKGEQIAELLVSGHIEGTGRYKLLAKKKKDGKFEWAHFTERDNGAKENIYRGEVKDADELKLVISIMNKNLTKIFGDKAEMVPGDPQFSKLNETEFNRNIN